MVTRRSGVPASGGFAGRHRDQVTQAVRSKLLRRDPSIRKFIDNSSLQHAEGLVDLYYCFPGDTIKPVEAFERLRWGGQFVYISRRKNEVLAEAQQYYGRNGFEIDEGLGSVRLRRFVFALPLFGDTYYYFIARKVLLLLPGQANRRFTFDVRLTRHGSVNGGYAVVKQVPSYTNIVARLRDAFPDADLDTIEVRARKLVDRVFPIFLTRETAFLNILQRDLPEKFRNRVPRVLAAQKGEGGFVRRLFIGWLRQGGPQLSQIQFARQSAELLRELHDTIGLIHLDLRLDNLVITENGVGFVDFGSAVRVGENIGDSPMLKSLFNELMSTSQIQKTLGRMKSSGQVTSEIIGNAHQEIDLAVDLFHLAVQMNKPHKHPEFERLVSYVPGSAEARRLQRLTEAILKPKDPKHPKITCAKHLLKGIRRVEETLIYEAENPDNGRGQERA